MLSPPKTLQSERLILRPRTADDTETLFEVFSDPRVMRFWNSPPVTERDSVATFLSGLDSSTACPLQWIIVRRQDHVPVGTCMLLHVNLAHRRAEIAYALAQAHWGKGYMYEALRSLLNFVFAELGLIRLEADVDPRNLPSIRTLERLGFQREGHLRERWIVNGECQDALWYGLLANEWKP